MGSSVVSGGKTNSASGESSVIMGGSNNTASGANSIAIGTNAIAKKDQSMVINLLTGKDAKAKDKGEFRLHSKVFTIRINNVEVKIDKNNIKNFKKLLKDNNRRHLGNIINNKQQEQIDDQQKQLVQQEAINEELHKQIVVQEERIVKQDKRINELHRMMTNLLLSQSSE